MEHFGWILMEVPAAKPRKQRLISSTRPALTSVSAPFRMTRRLPLPARRTFAAIDRTTGSRFGPLAPFPPAAPRRSLPQAQLDFDLKFAHALGAHVVVFTTSPNKKEDALGLGADEVVVSRNADEMQKHAGSFDFILDAVSADHDINAYINLLRRDGNLTLVGAPAKPLGVSAFGLSWDAAASPARHRRHCRDPGDARLLRRAQHHRRCRSHPHPEGQRSLRGLLKSDVKYRFSIDMASLKSE